MRESSTRVVLVEFEPAGREIRPGSEGRWYGIHDLAFRVVNIDAVARFIENRGYPLTIPPVGIQLPGAPYIVKEGMFLGPGNVPHAFMERVLSPPQGDLWKFTHIGDSVQIVENIEEALHFYVDQLGLDLLGQDIPPVGLFSKILGVGPDVSTRLAFVNRKGTNALLIELMEISAQPRYPLIPACPPNIGLFMISLKVDRLESTLKPLSADKTPVWSGPVNLDGIVWGMQKACVVQGPGRALVCLFENEP
jgi:catechol 2,3-dioxygenase-like lactoylglutathione lyase family enzyme